MNTDILIILPNELNEEIKKEWKSEDLESVLSIIDITNFYGESEDPEKKVALIYYNKENKLFVRITTQIEYVYDFELESIEEIYENRYRGHLLSNFTKCSFAIKLSTEILYLLIKGGIPVNK